MSPLETEMDEVDDEATERNRRIFATYSRPKLIQFCIDTGVSIGGEGKTREARLSELNDQDLRELALAITQGL